MRVLRSSGMICVLPIIIYSPPLLPKSHPTHVKNVHDVHDVPPHLLSILFSTTRATTISNSPKVLSVLLTCPHPALKYPPPHYILAFPLL